MKTRITSGHLATLGLWIVSVCLGGLLSLSLAVPLHAAHPALQPGELAAFFDAEIPRVLDEKQIPGAAVVVVHDGAIVFEQGYGWAHVDNQTQSPAPVDPRHTIFRTGSVGKMFTWTAVMQLVEQGQLDLDADVNTYLDFSIPATFAEPITLRHLLTHTPGFENLGEDLFVLEAEAMRGLRDYLVTRMPVRLYAPGTVGAYSNYGAALAGYIVERASGMPFHQYAQTHIFAPLGMDATTLEQPVPPPLAARLSPGYGLVDGQLLPGEFIYVAPYPAGSSSATATDMAQFMLAHLNTDGDGPARLLAPATLAQMQSSHYRADPRLPGMALGWMEREINGQRVLYHKGSIVAYHTGLYLIPEANLGVYMVFNGTNAVLAPDPLFFGLLDVLFPGQPSTSDSATFRDMDLTPYLGEYHTTVADASSAGKILRMLEPAVVSRAPTGELAVSSMGLTERYVPDAQASGLFYSVEHGQHLLFQTDANGIRWLLRGGEPHFPFYQPPWYALSTTTALTLVLGLLLLVGTELASLVGRSISFLRHRKPLPKPVPPTTVARPPVWVRLPSLAYTVLLVAYILTFVSILGTLHPVYGVPTIMFGTPPGELLLLGLPWLMALAALGMLVALVVVWQRDIWRRWRRIYATLLTVLAWAILALLAYWNLWTLPG